MSKSKLDSDKEAEMKRKVFVGGISKTTDESDLEAYFSKFGDIEDILVNRSAKTGASKGCAFLLFKSQKVAEALIKDPKKHELKGKMVECKSSHRKSKLKKSTKSSKNSKKELSHPSPVSQIAQLSTAVPIMSLERPLPSRRNGGTDVEPRRQKGSFKRIKSTLDSILSRCFKTYQNCNTGNIYYRYPQPQIDEEEENSDSGFKLENFVMKNEETSDLDKITFFDRSRVNYWRYY